MNSARKAFSSGISLNPLSQPSILARLSKPHKAVNPPTEPPYLCLRTRRDLTPLKRPGFFYLNATCFLPHSLCSSNLSGLTTYVLSEINSHIYSPKYGLLRGLRKIPRDTFKSHRTKIHIPFETYFIMVNNKRSVQQDGNHEKTN